MRALIWNEFLHERSDARVRAIYPDGIHQALTGALRENLDAVDVEVATLDEAEHGLSEPRLAMTDVLIWWGHVGHERVGDAEAERVQRHVLGGMGFVALHSAHLSKPFRLLMGTSCHLRWRDAEDRELIWTVAPGHPIARGAPSPLVLDAHEMYGEYFDVPAPDELIFVSSFSGGEVFRSGCCWRRGAGRVAFFSPGHETFPVYHRPDIRQIVANAARWAATGEPRRPASESKSVAPGWFAQATDRRA